MPPKKSKKPPWSKGSTDSLDYQRKPEIDNKRKTHFDHNFEQDFNGLKDFNDERKRFQKFGLINGLKNGRINGLKNGRINGLKNGRINGLKNGRINGLKNGRINGLKNGRINGLKDGRINGLKNNRGLYNGLVNGLERKTGWVNGNGFINGFRLTNFPHSMPLQKRNFSLRVALIIIIVSAMIVIPFYLISTMPSSTIKIDGYFFDWDRAGYFEEMEPNAAPDVDIRKYSVVVWHDIVYCYISTTDSMFSLPNSVPQAFYAFIDVDNDRNTGYLLQDIGADLLIEIIGWDGSIRQSHLSEFSDDRDRRDFNGFSERIPINAKASGNQLEFSFLNSHSENPTVRFLAKNGYGSEDSSQFAIRYSEPAISVVIDLTIPEIITPNMLEEVMTIEMQAQRGDGRILGINFEKLGNASDFRLFLYENSDLIAQANNTNLSFFEPLLVREGYGKTLTLFVEIDVTETTSSFGLSLLPDAVVTQDGPISINEIQTCARIAYVGEIPREIVIDGAFADWANGLITLDSDGDVQSEDGSVIIDESIDIRKYGMFVGENDLAMYLAVDGGMLNGTVLPKDIQLPQPSSGLPPLEAPELIGADVAGAMIDVDLNASTGSNISEAIGADFLVLVTGKEGVILLSQLYIWSDAENGSWMFLDNISSAVDCSRMEFALNISYLGLNSTDVALVGFFMTDWKKGTDYSDSVLLLAIWQGDWFGKEFGGIIMNEIYHSKELDWVELYNTSTEPISLSGWTLYDGSDIIYTFGDVTIQPGEFFVIPDLDLGKKADLILVDDQGVVIDSMSTSEKNLKSYGRTGDPPYSKWKVLDPTPGELNPGQTAIPEFSSIILAIIGAVIFPLVLRSKKRKAKHG